VKYFLIGLLFYSSLFAQNKKWGWETHGYINEHAVDYLPAEMSFFQDHRNYLQQHSVDPDMDQLPGYFHYIDIDYYQEFFSGTLPHDMDSLITLYGLSIVQNNGIIPWIIEEWTDSLSTLMATGQWEDVWQIAAELGHYVADSHQPLHLAINYDGQFSGNDGIHARYETQMINQHLLQLPLPQDRGIYCSNIIEFVFSYIEDIYPFVDKIMIADDLASSLDPTFNTTYYDFLWQELDQISISSINKAIVNLASLWRTAWENADSPSPLSIEFNHHCPEFFLITKNYPNPFNQTTLITYEIPVMMYVEVNIYNQLGEKITTLLSGKQPAGYHSALWDASGLASGIYYYRIEAGEFQDVEKMILLR
jgi:hypothetical protein